MPDYKETQVAGTQWRRAQRLIIENPLDGTPSVTAIEQDVISLGDGKTIKTDVGLISTPFNPSLQFPVIDPITGEGTGELASMYEAYMILYSFYMYQAGERDALAVE